MLPGEPSSRPVGDFELRLLQYFVAVAEERHFGRAAQRVHIAESPLSRQIRQLEAEVGAPLLSRTTRRVELTSAGGVFLDHARRILAQVEAARVAAERAHRGALGRLAIGFTGAATSELLPPLARAYAGRYPAVELELRGDLLSPKQLQAILSGDLDVGFLRPPVRIAELATQTLRREPLVAAIPQAHPLAMHRRLAPKELAGEPFIAFPGRFEPWRSVVYDAMLDACQRAGFLPHVAQEVWETHTLLYLVAAGVGVSLVPASVAHLQVAGVAYRLLRGRAPRVGLAMAWRATDRSPVLQTFLDLVREVIAPSMRTP